MNRISKFIVAGSIAGMVALPALANQGQSIPGQKLPGQTGQGQGQFQGQAQVGAKQGATFGGVTQNPWFGDKAVQQQMNFKGEQVNGLNKAYGEARTKYNAGLEQIANLPEAQRAQKMQELQAGFNQSFGKSVDGVITDPQQRQRYNQLNLQYQGYNAFNDPTVQQQLNLTDEQRQKIAQYGQEWNQQMAGYQQRYQTDPQGTTKLYNEMGKQTNERLNTVLNPQQQQTWRQMTGDPYNFPPSVYFHGAGSVQGNGIQRNGGVQTSPPK